MLRCKHVADALARHHYWDLPWARRIGLQTHVYLCLFCGRFHRQVMLMQDAARRFRRYEAETPPPPMPAEARERLRRSLRPPPPS